MRTSHLMKLAAVFSILSAIAILGVVPFTATLRGLGGPGPIDFGDATILSRLAMAGSAPVWVDIDPDWSPQAEFQLSDYVARHPEIVNVYGMPTIHCRESGCLALFVAPGYLDHARNYPDPKLRSFGESSMGAGEIFRADNREFFNDPAAKQFSDKEGVVSEGYLQDGVAGIVWIVPRRKADK